MIFEIFLTGPSNIRGRRLQPMLRVAYRIIRPWAYRVLPSFSILLTYADNDNI